MPRGRLIKIDVTGPEDDFIKEIVVGIERDEDPPSCSFCGSYRVWITRTDKEEGLAEYRCDDCREYSIGEHHE